MQLYHINVGTRYNDINMIPGIW